MPTTTMQHQAPVRLRPGSDARRSQLRRDLERFARAPGDPALAPARVSVYERVRSDLDSVGLEAALSRAGAAYRLVPMVPPRLRASHPAARARGEAFEQVFEAAGVDARQVELLRRVRPRFVDEPQAAS